MSSLSALDRPAAQSLSQGTPTAQGSSELTGSLRVQGYWEAADPALLYQSDLEAGPDRLTLVTLQAGFSGVEREICLTNKGAASAKNLTLEDSIEYQVSGVEFRAAVEPFVMQVEEELPPGEERCYLNRLDFIPMPQSSYRITPRVLATNLAGWLPGSRNCLGADACPQGPSFLAEFELPLVPVTGIISTRTPTPTITPPRRAFPVAQTPSPLPPGPLPAPSATPMDTLTQAPSQTGVPSQTAVPTQAPTLGPTPTPEPTNTPKPTKTDKPIQEPNTRKTEVATLATLMRARMGERRRYNNIPVQSVFM